MISISKRLRMAADLVPSCDVLADVGTDHSYLPVWLIQNHVARHVLASDVRRGPLQRAMETVAEHALSQEIDVILADGLSYAQSETAEVITICGMGGETMISILSSAPWTKEGRTLILQPQSKLRELEHWLRETGYAVTGASLCQDGGKLYLAMRVLGGGIWSCGAENRLAADRDPLFPEYLSEERKKTEHALQGMRCAQGDRSTELSALEHRLQMLQEYEKEAAAW